MVKKIDKLSYTDVIELMIENYNELIEDEGLSPDQAIAATLEDSVLIMRASEKAYVSAIMTLAILSLKQNFIPDYLLERLDMDSFKKIEGLDTEEREIFKKEINSLENLLNTSDYKVDKDEAYRMRVNMLLGKTS